MLDHEVTDQMFQALSDASRRRMVEQLTHGPASATELSRPFEMTLSAVMQHLAVLERAGLVGSEKIGRVRTYRLVTAPLREIEGWLHRQRTGWDNRLDLLEATLTAKSPPGPTEGEQP